MQKNICNTAAGGMTGAYNRPTVMTMDLLERGMKVKSVDGEILSGSPKSNEDKDVLQISLNHLLEKRSSKS